MSRERNISVGGGAKDAIFVTGDRNTLHFGLSDEPSGFRSRVKRLQQFYLGSTSSPVPFGGRDREIGELNNWLADNQSPSNVLITAPAGRGKTALLIRWLAQIPQDWPLAFIPISIRFETNHSSVFYQALAIRLSEILGDRLRLPPADAATRYKDLAIDYLDQLEGADKKCLLVIDGLDEAAGWDVNTSVLPLESSGNIRIIVSARRLAGDRGPSDWLRRIGWARPGLRVHVIDVPPLDRHGISDVLSKMGSPVRDLADKYDVVSELHRLTEGGDDRVPGRGVAAWLRLWSPALAGLVRLPRRAA